MFRAYASTENGQNKYPGSIMLTQEDGYDPTLISKVNQQMQVCQEELSEQTNTSRTELMEKMTTMLEKFGVQYPNITSKELYESHPMMVFGECKEPSCFMSRTTCPGIRLMIEDQFSEHLTKQLEKNAEADIFKIGIHGMGGFLTELLILTNTLNEFDAGDEDITELHLTGDKFGEFLEYLTLEIADNNSKTIILDQIKFSDQDKTNYYRVKFFIMIRIMEWFKVMNHVVHIYLHTEENIMRQRAQLDAFMSIDYVDQFIAHQITSGYAIANQCVKQGGLSMLARTNGLMQQPNFFIEIRYKEENIDEDEVAYDYVMNEKTKELDEQVRLIEQNTTYYVNPKVLNYAIDQTLDILDTLDALDTTNNTSDTADDFDDDPFGFERANRLCRINHPNPMLLTLSQLKEHSSEPQKFEFKSNRILFTRLPSGETCEFIVETKPEVYNLEERKREIEAETMNIIQEYYDESFIPVVQHNGFCRPILSASMYLWALMTWRQRLTYIGSIPIRIGLGFAIFGKELITLMSDKILNKFGYYRTDDLKQFKSNFYCANTSEKINPIEINSVQEGPIEIIPVKAGSEIKPIQVINEEFDDSELAGPVLPEIEDIEDL